MTAMHFCACLELLLGARLQAASCGSELFPCSNHSSTRERCEEDALGEITLHGWGATLPKEEEASVQENTDGNEQWWSSRFMPNKRLKYWLSPSHHHRGRGTCHARLSHIHSTSAAATQGTDVEREAPNHVIPYNSPCQGYTCWLQKKVPQEEWNHGDGHGGGRLKVKNPKQIKQWMHDQFTSKHCFSRSKYHLILQSP